MIKKITCFIMALAFCVSAFSVTGGAAISAPKFDVYIDEQTRELCDMVKESSYIDLENMVTNLPDLSAPVKLLHTVFFLDNGEFSKAMYALRDKCYSEGHITLGKLFYFIGAYYKGFEKCEISLQEQEGGYLEFILDVSYADGEKTSIHSGAYYNPETGLFYGKEDKGMFEIGYNFDINEMVVYATVNSWMRQFGFCLEYDILAYTTPFYFYHTRRFKFFYEGKEWMIQVWKGMYVAANGAEV
ncbi:MAG: DUF4474 domain-containing protein, partial [Clostridia bacterium]|nr:DUF4474 domain-containing protein [Clostridia bacterium]